MTYRLQSIVCDRTSSATCGLYLSNECVATVDGRRVGRTPVTVRVTPGRHNVVVVSADGRRAQRTVYADRAPQTIFVNLE